MSLLLPPPSSIKSHPLRRKITNQSPIQFRNIISRSSKLALFGKIEGIQSQIHFDAAETTSFTSSVGSPALPQWTLGRKHILLLNLTASVVAISASWLFFSAIPTLLAFKRAAESLEKLLDVTAEELPDTMAAVRLSGMEISDLTMELSDLGQEITKGVRSSTRAVRVADDRLRRLTTMAPTVSAQGQSTPRNETEGPVLARTARNVREGIVKGRAVLGFIFVITQFSRWALNFLAARRQKRSL